MQTHAFASTRTIALWCSYEHLTSRIIVIVCCLFYDFDERVRERGIAVDSHDAVRGTAGGDIQNYGRRPEYI